MAVQESVCRILDALGVSPVLVDIGASIKPPDIWTPIASRSVYVGFDPDLRDFRTVQDGVFKVAYTMNSAVTDGRDSGRVPFYFTSSPYCSSTLPPDAAALEQWFFAPLFAVERVGQVNTTTLGRVAADLGLSRLDWVKTDSQGTDLRVLTALEPGLWDGLLAVDIEPGLIDAYQGEDLFVEAHACLTARGFWLSDLSLGRCVRMRRSTYAALADRLPGLAADQVETKLPTSPGWVNARYLRTIESSQGLGRDRLALLWVFALLDNQPGYALDLAVEYERRFGRDELHPLLVDAPLGLLLGARNRP